jgi:hypothetical protein
MTELLASNQPFERIYSLDLVYQPDCWKLCGDAHCCSFSRHKARFRLLKGDGKPAQELPLLPGEFEFLQTQGWTAQFQNISRRRIVYGFGPGRVVYDTITSDRPGCACDHDTRTTICRLYPLLPVFSVDGRLIATEPIGLYEELERIDGLEPACRLETLPFAQLNLYLGLANAIASDPVLLFHTMAYRIVKHHVAGRIEAARGDTCSSSFSLFERSLIRRQLFDHDAIKEELAFLWAKFAEHHGTTFVKAMDALPQEP